MPAFDQIWIYLLAAMATGLGLGAYLALALTDRHAHHSEVRWKRRFTELVTEHEFRTATLNKNLSHAEEKQATLRQALDESEETVRLLSADRVPAYEQDIAERNARLAELEKKMAHYRAEIADAQDQEMVLRNQIDSLQSELQQRDKRIAELSTRTGTQRRHADSDASDRQKQIDAPREKPIETRNGSARVISIHKHLKTDDLVAHRQSGKPRDDSARRIGAVEIGLQNWQRDYESARDGHDRNTSELALASDGAGGQRRGRDDLKLIRGIGPVLETTLNRLGFFQFQQLADMNQSDIDKMARYDSSLPGRLQRYNWAEQARKLHEARLPDRFRPRV